MILNNVEINILATIELIDAYNKNIPEDFLNINVIYCIHNKVNNKNYIGQTVNFKDRFSESYIGHFKDYNKFINGKLGDRRILYRAWQKYGLESFVVYIIDTAEDRDGLNEKEMFWIKTLHTCTKDSECLGYNLSWGADDMGVKDPDAIQRGIQTRIERYGEAFANCHTPEAFAKGNKTKEERYGHGGFVNADTPEAKEKRKQTMLSRFGMLTTTPLYFERNIKLYGNKLGACNTPENREKGRINRRITLCFKAISKVLSLSDKNIDNLNDYKELALKRYRDSEGYENHLNILAELLPRLKSDKRWTEQYEKIFGSQKII